jgi:signal transduction histidine kinase/CheY-like chemotaxis protein
MSIADHPTGASGEAKASSSPRGRLFRKYVGLFAAVLCAALVANGLTEIWFSFREQQAFLVRIQREQAEAAASKIAQFVKGIEGHLGWAIQLPFNASDLQEWRFDAVRVMRQVPAITELAQIDASGRERIRMSRLATDVIGSQRDFSQDPAFIGAMANKVYYGPVYFRRESEPYMTLAIAGARRDYGVILAEVNLKSIWDTVSQIKVGERGQAYVVDEQARLIAHPDINLVLRNTDLSHLAQVRAARADGSQEYEQAAENLQGVKVLSAHARVAPLDWLVFVELPLNEAYAPLYASILRSAAFLGAALIVAVFAGMLLAQRMVIPIRALRDGAVRIGGGDLSQRISIRTGDELEALGNQFNSMAAKLQESYATLERRVEERTRQLELANDAKSRFLATASHDLRQPLHALGLFAAQLRQRPSEDDRGQIVERINEAVAAMNELFNALLDISKLDAGALAPNVTEFPIAQVLKRIESTFAGAAREKHLSLRLSPCDAWVRSDPVLLERILLNLVSNAVRYTSKGGVIVGCRRRGDRLRVEVWDTGAGIPPDQRETIFSEFYRLGNRGADEGIGLGLGLAIVDRLCRLLGHSIELTSAVGKGSRFSIVAPLVAPQTIVAEAPRPIHVALEASKGKLIVVLDDDPLALDGMGGLLRSWGCRVVSGDSLASALKGLAADDRLPDLIISDYHLPDGRTGIEAIERLRAKFGLPIPAFLISGDTHSEPLREARAGGYLLLHKPVEPLTLRATLSRMLKQDRVADLQS